MKHSKDMFGPAELLRGHERINCKSHVSNMGRGIWNLTIGTWDPPIAIRNWELGTWISNHALDCGVWDSELGVRELKPETPVSKRATRSLARGNLDYEYYKLVNRTSVGERQRELEIRDVGDCIGILDFEYRDANHGVRQLKHGD